MESGGVNSGVANNRALILDNGAGVKSSNGGGGAQPAFPATAHHYSRFGVGGSSSSSPYLKVSRPVTPFVRKTYDMVKDPQTNAILSWNSTGNGFIIWDAHKFAAEILPCYFKHNNFSSFICQLNTYGFKKASWDKCEFHHEWFQKGKNSWLKNVKRKSNQSAQLVPIQDQQLQFPGEEIGMLKMVKEINEMQGEQREIMMEIKKLQEQQEILAKELADMIKKAPSPEEKRRQLPMIMAEALLESIVELDNNGNTEEKERNESVREEIDDPKGKTLVEEVQKATGEMESNNVLASESYTRLEKKMLIDDLNIEKLVEERPDIVIGLDDLMEGPVDRGNYVKQLGEKGADDLKSRP